MIYILRHGETDYNKEGRLQGQLDIDLNQNGIMQAEALKKSLSSLSFDKIYSSDLIRAKRTAEIIAGTRTIILDKRLREIDLGSWQGRTYDDLRANDELYNIFYSNPDLANNGDHEDYCDVIARMESFFNSIDKDEDAVVVSHGFIIFHYFKKYFSDFRPIENCEIISYDIKNNIISR
ncbi:MAG: histidine phosphatase family protein [Ezakiella sp.]|nr:histidine phosphatase family protein [Ezakiella sp.]MDD7762134.1 histidine phosphatase family protein [Bacillota bacterium]MDY3946874.1 histidine phosphatase family protein [Ezakiella sp.]